MRVAVYESTDPLFAYLIVSAARRRGHTAKQVATLDEIGRVFVASPEAIMVGIGHLDAHALDALSELRAAHSEALIYIAAEAAGSRSTLSALSGGATDIIQKPLLPGDLVVRAEIAAANRGFLNQSGGAIRVADLEIDLNQAMATKVGRELALTRMELRLLYCLAQHRGRIAPTERLLAFARDSDEYATSSLKTHISHLRQKLFEAGGRPVTIKARQMLGYVLDVANAE